MASIFSAVSTLLKPRTERDASVYEVISRVRTRVETEVPAVRTEFIQILQDLIGGLAGTPSPVEIKLFHPDLRIAERASAAVAAAIESVPRFPFPGTAPDAIFSDSLPSGR